MIKVLFICHGNVCRSTMSQFVFQDMVNKCGKQNEFHIDSAATSREEIGNGPHYGTVRKLNKVGVPVLHHRARQLTRKDYDRYDYLIAWTQLISGICSESAAAIRRERFASSWSLQERKGI